MIFFSPTKHDIKPKYLILPYSQTQIHKKSVMIKKKNTKIIDILNRTHTKAKAIYKLKERIFIVTTKYDTAKNPRQAIN